MGSAAGGVHALTASSSGVERLTLIIAVIFGYYESLLRLGDKQKILEEETRLKSLHNILNQVGYQEYIYEIWADEAFLLLQEVAASIGQPDDEAALLAAFNDDNRSKSIMTYFKARSSHHCLISALFAADHPPVFDLSMAANPSRSVPASRRKANSRILRHPHRAYRP